jgi:hypothetical protein
MKTINMYLLFSGVLAVSIVSGCATRCEYAVPLYSGERLPRSKVAKLHFTYGTNELTIDGTDAFQIVEGQRLHRSRALAVGEFTPYSAPGEWIIEILPGKHEIKWVAKYKSLNFPYIGKGTLDAKAGANYRIIEWFKKGALQHTRLLGGYSFGAPTLKPGGSVQTYIVTDYGTYIRRDDFFNHSKEDWTPHH